MFIARTSFPSLKRLIPRNRDFNRILRRTNEELSGVLRVLGLLYSANDLNGFLLCFGHPSTSFMVCVVVENGGFGFNVPEMMEKI